MVEKLIRRLWMTHQKWYFKVQNSNTVEFPVGVGVDIVGKTRSEIFYEDSEVIFVQKESFQILFWRPDATRQVLFFYGFALISFRPHQAIYQY